MPSSPHAARQPVARRRQLLDAAAWTFARKGYRAAAISDIIDRARVARGTFYLYFDSKEQVFLAIVEAFHDRVRRMLEEPESPVRLTEHLGQAVLQRSFHRWLELFAADRDVAAVILKEATSIDAGLAAETARLRDTAIHHFAERFRRLQTRGLVNSSLLPDVVAHLQLAMLEELVNAFVLAERSTDLDDLAAQVARFAWNGIRPHFGDTTGGSKDPPYTL